jgi:uncharacterized membrane protein YqaE (UPF0057 family)
MPEVEVVGAVWKAKGLWAVHVIVNAVLLFLVYALAARRHAGAFQSCA